MKDPHIKTGNLVQGATGLDAKMPIASRADLEKMHNAKKCCIWDVKRYK